MRPWTPALLVILTQLACSTSEGSDEPTGEPAPFGDNTQLDLRETGDGEQVVDGQCADLLCGLGQCINNACGLGICEGQASPPGSACESCMACLDAAPENPSDCDPSCSRCQTCLDGAMSADDATCQAQLSSCGANPSCFETLCCMFGCPQGCEPESCGGSCGSSCM